VIVVCAFGNGLNAAPTACSDRYFTSATDAYSNQVYAPTVPALAQARIATLDGLATGQAEG
jgi:hypothetical protein